MTSLPNRGRRRPRTPSSSAFGAVVNISNKSTAAIGAMSMSSHKSLTSGRDPLKGMSLVDFFAQKRSGGFGGGFVIRKKTVIYKWGYNL